MVALVIVAHSAKLAEGVKELADQMVQGRVPIFAAGGLDAHTLGTNVERIREALEAALSRADEVLVLMDLGSAVMGTQMAVEMLPPEVRPRILLSQAPLVEGAIVAAVEAAIGKGATEVEASAVEACRMPKVIR
ncbi:MULTISPECIES: dihydroxyacetone kinase phosphoryl donor subunit DhaM [Thermoflexus]|jgi:dihydroxyacetone kinase phosphotransfer subunit|uniref:dihydroxyacetone kinase phosphoryl donor subunit DhaM n=1 Tax=Thermoflexus TaxID=1495649 RepID=UPI001C7627EB|nr:MULTISPECIES: dihydroxyacetone kinase phosphoryl donor subunit DhaM [Thermoflexus]MDT7946851.1 dihydroxyacetone kinase phosphoryl donor subunit DhaM [Thermoflexus sp.]QWK10372.1 MAG: PTS-dependent dihydroxyacetone kinase phosphotransferase subunit DhaM [Thermoflexus hugenholtzii]